MGKRVVFDLNSGHNFQRKYRYFDHFFTSLRLLENLKLLNIKACATIRLCQEKQNGTRRLQISGSIEQYCLHMDGHRTGFIGVKLSSRQRSCSDFRSFEKWPTYYNQFAHGVDKLGQRISCYKLDRKSKRNWLRMFTYFLNASICNSFICYNQLAQDKLT